MHVHMFDRVARSSVTALLGAMWIVPTGVAGAPTALDPSYGAGGIARLAEGIIWADAAYADGRIALVLGDALATNAFPTARRVVRLDASGRTDAAFAPIDNFAGYLIQSIAVTPTGRLVTLQARYTSPQGELRATRHLSDGTPDAAFGENGVAVVSRFAYESHARFETGEFVITRMIADERDRAYFAVREIADRGFARSTWVDRIAESGAPVEVLGYSTASSEIFHQSLLVDPEDRVVALTYRREPTLGGPETSGPALLRLVDGVPDSMFGVRGFAYQPIQGWTDAAFSTATAYDGLSATPDGGYVVIGRIRTNGFTDVPAVVKFTSQGAWDRSFGDGGIARVRFTSADTSTSRAMIAVQSDGAIVVAASAIEGALPFVALARLTASGQPDARFAPGGVTTFWVDHGTQAKSLHVQPDGRIVVVGAFREQPTGPETPAVFRFRGGDLPKERPLRERTAVEYFHADYGHYFLTADAHEILDLDRNPASGWTRTGKSFAVWDQSDPSLAQSCRFWSGQSFAPKSSHFYTPYAGECASLTAGETWTFERNAFALRLPQGADGSRTCDDGSRPLYRAYNNGIGGAPNHRYTIDVGVLDAMIAQGWSMEGEARTRVFACVPLP